MPRARGWISIILHYGFIRAESGPGSTRRCKKHVLIHTGIRTALFLLPDLAISRASACEVSSVPLRATSSIKLNFALAILVKPSVTEDGSVDIALSPSRPRHKFAMFSRISSQFVRIARADRPPSRSLLLRPLPLPFLRLASFFLLRCAGYAERVRVRTRIELDAALLNTQCDLFEYAAYKTQRTAYDW